MADKTDVDRLRASPLFDAKWYRNVYLDVALSGMDPAVHYLDFGARQGRDPGPAFSSSAYLEKHPDAGADGTNPLIHFIEQGAGKTGQVSPVRENGMPRPPHSKLVAESELFDAEWYSASYPTVGLAGVDPVEHYLRVGSALGYDPGPGFSTTAYLRRHRSVREAGVNPLVHYLRYGMREGRVIDPSTRPFGVNADDRVLLEMSELFDADWYRAHYSDVARSGLDAATHYLLTGAWSLYDPSPAFSTSAYLTSAPDVHARGRNPLVHYIKYGRAEGRKIAPSADSGPPTRSRMSERKRKLSETHFFDPRWYVSRYPDVAASGLDPEEHYLRIGADLLRDPSPHFSTAAYAARNPDVFSAGVNVLEHYISTGVIEGRQIAADPAHPALTSQPVHVPKTSSGSPAVRSSARVVAFYLPQFHPIPQNDEWWGEGFTEWTGVRPAQPQYPGHYQPHVPGELGYYDLRDPDVQRRQIDLAKLYGVDAFCFYFYWFDGVTLLETPLRNWLEDSSLDFPFMLCWANENWSRRWDGRENDILIAQNHSPEDDIAFIEHAAEYLRDPRYTRIDGRPVLVVYRPSLLPDAAETARRWRDWCRENGVGEIYLAYTTSFDRMDPELIGFDAAIEFAPNNMGIPDVTRNQPTYRNFGGRMYDWTELERRSLAHSSPGHTLFRGVNPSWDNTPRRGENAGILAGSNPAAFTRWTRNAILETGRAQLGPDDNLVFVNAWNEWGEGAHLEPDEAYGYAWLESIRVAHALSAESSVLTPSSKIGLVLDLTVSPLPATLPRWVEDACTEGRAWVIVNADGPSGKAALLSSAHRIEAPHETGMLGLLAAMPELAGSGADLIFVVDLAETDLGSIADPAVTLAQFVANPRLGLVRMGITREVDHLKPFVSAIGARAGAEEAHLEYLPLTAGGSFAIRTNALAPLAALTFDREDADPRGSRFVPFLGDVLNSAMSASTMAAGLREQPPSSITRSADRPSVLVVTHDLHPHGAQRLALAIGSGYRDCGFDVSFLALEDGPLHVDYQHIGHTDIVTTSAADAARTRRTIRAIVARGTRVAVVNTTAAAGIIPMLKAEGLSVVSLVHEMPGVLSDMHLGREARIVAEAADAVVFPSSMVQSGFEKFLGMNELPHAVVRHQGEYLPADGFADPDSVREELGIGHDRKVILAVGYGDRRKGIDLFGRVVTEVLAADPTTEAIWVGHLGRDGAFEECRETVSQARVSDRVHFTGLVDPGRMRDFYALADVALVPSREDPFPSSLMEAMGSGVPVLAFEGRCGNEGFLARGAGSLIPGLDVGEMARRVRGLLDDPDQRSTMGQTGRTIRDAEFDFNSYLYDLLDIAGDPFPRISVVVPNFNYARLLPERLASIEEQTFPIYELIILDDASTDFSSEVIERYVAEHPFHVRFVPNRENSGSVFKQWLKGAELARGEFVWIAEADDLADPDFLRVTVAPFTDTDVVLSYTQSRAINSHGMVSMPDYLAYVADLDDSRWRASYIADGIDEIKAGLFVKNTIPNVSAVLFRTSTLLDVLRDAKDGILPLRNAGDWLTYLRVLEKGKVAFHATPRSSHRRHDSSVTISNFAASQLVEIRAVQDATIRRHDLGDEAKEAADKYAQTLYEQFGLVEPTAPQVSDSSQAGADAVTGLSTLLQPMRIGVVSIPRRLPDAAQMPFEDLYGAIGRNTGNYMFTEAMFRQLDGAVDHIGFGFEPEAVNERYDLVVIPAANWLNRASDWTFLVEKVQRLRIPVVMIGVGLQADSEDLAAVQIHPSALELVRAVADRSALISTRGDFTTDWLKRQGYGDVVTTGCPSTYMRQAASSRGAGEGLVLQSTRYGLARTFGGGGGLNEVLFRLAAALDVEMLYQSEPEELQALLTQSGDRALRAAESGVLANTYGLGDDADAVSYIARRGKAFLDLDEWSRWVATKSSQFGTRLHGTILALNSGVPAVLAPHDSRTAEVARFANIPTFNFRRDEGLDARSVEQAVAEADVASFHGTRRRNVVGYKDFLRANGLTADPDGFAP